MSTSEVSSGSTMNSIVGLVNSAQEKWVSSGGNEVMGKVSAAIPESTKNYVSNVFKRDHLRSISIFFGIGEDRPFYMESTPSLLIERLRHNLTFFYMNYFLIAGVLFCLTLITSPTVLIGMALLAAAWMWVIRAAQAGSLKVGGITIPHQTATIVMAVISGFVLLYLSTSVIWWTLFTSGFFVALHAFFRDASMHKDMEDAVAMEGDLQLGEDAAFLNVASVDQV